MRGFNRIASGLLGLVLIAGGLLAVIEAAVVGAGRRPVWFPLRRWYQSLVDTEISSTTVLYVAIGIGVLGLLVLFFELRPWAPDRVLVGAQAGAGEDSTDTTHALAALAAPTGEVDAAEAGGVPARPGSAPADAGTGPPWWVSRRSVQRRTASAAATVSGVTKGHATVRGRPDSWRLRVRAQGPQDRYEAVSRAVRGELDRLNAPAGTSVELALRTPRRRVV